MSPDRQTDCEAISRRGVRHVEIYAGVARVGVCVRHLPERIFNNPRCVHSDAEFEEQHAPAAVTPDKPLIARAGGVPAFVLDEGAVRTQVERHGLAADGTAWNQLLGHFHVLLPREHSRTAASLS